MVGCETRNPDYPIVEFVLDAVAGWIGKCRFGPDNGDELGQCSHDDRMQIAKDLGLPVSDLRGLTAKKSGAADAVSEMLRALTIDASTLTEREPATVRDLQRTCMFCPANRRCRQELAESTAARNFREFCPNAYTLEAVLSERERPQSH